MTREEALKVVRAAREAGERTDLSGADLSGADLRSADLSGADLRSADLRYANMSDADMSDANLYGANLYGANLRYANMSDADMHGAGWGGLTFTGLPSGNGTLRPTPSGWYLSIGCEARGLSDMREMIEGDDWPESRGQQIIDRRPTLLAAIAMCEAHAQTNRHVVRELAKRWGTK